MAKREKRLKKQEESLLEQAEKHRIISMAYYRSYVA